MINNSFTMLLGIPKKRLSIIRILFIAFYLMLYVIFNEKILSDELLLLLLTCMIFCVIIHEIFHAFGALFGGVSLRELSISITFEKGFCSCSIDHAIDKKQFMLYLIFPIILPIISVAIFAITINTFFLALAYLLLIMSIMDILYFIDFVRLPKDSIISGSRNMYAFSVQNVDNVQLDLFKPIIFLKSGRTDLDVITTTQTANPRRIYISWLSTIVLLIAFSQLALRCWRILK